MALKHAEAGEVVNLRPFGDRLPDAKTSALVRTPGFEAVRLVVRAGAEIPEHKVPGRITLLCIEGMVDLGLSDGPRRLGAGDWIWLQGGEPHSVKGVEDASLLLTILFDS